MIFERGRKGLDLKFDPYVACRGFRRPLKTPENNKRKQ